LKSYVIYRLIAMTGEYYYIKLFTLQLKLYIISLSFDYMHLSYIAVWYIFVIRYIFKV